MGSGDIAECCSLMSKCHAEARQISCRSPNRSTQRQNGIYNNVLIVFKNEIYYTKLKKKPGHSFQQVVTFIILNNAT